MESNIKVVEKVGKNPGKNVVIMAGVHGDEVCGVRAFDELIPRIDIENGKVTFIYANLEGGRQNERFVEYNLNRCFLDEQPDEMAGSLEGKTAREILPFLRSADALLDLHSSETSDSLKYIICEEDCFDFISSFSLDKIILGINDSHPGSANGCMYRQGKPGICVECGLHETRDSVEVAKETIMKFLVGTGSIVGTGGENVSKRLFRAVYLYKNKNGPFKFVKKFKDFEEIVERTLIGYDGSKEIYLDKDDVIMFPYEAEMVGDECFMIIRKETLLKDNPLELGGNDGE